MSLVKITTLTSVHIGSGNILLYGNDFVKGTARDGFAIIGIIDPKKVMTLIGTNNIQSWVSQIERHIPTDQIIGQYNSSIVVEDYSQRTMLDFVRQIRPSDTLAEYIHDGFNRPYIPGSSIKGAIRTSVLSSLTDTLNQKEDLILKKDKRGQTKGVYADQIEAKLFGSNPNADVFRFLQVGDAIFDDKAELAAVRMVNINERPVSGFWDTGKSQLVEVLLSDSQTEFELSLKKDAFSEIKKWDSKDIVHSLPECMRDMHSLFAVINKHTLTLLEDEYRYWLGKTNLDDSGHVDDYIKRIEKLMEITRCCEKDKGQSCILRIGYGSGWRFITGAWTEKLHSFKSSVIPSSRPRNDRYSEFSFPKSRRLDEEGELLGFVRLEEA